MLSMSKLQNTVNNIQNEILWLNEQLYEGRRIRKWLLDQQSSIHKSKMSLDKSQNIKEDTISSLNPNFICEELLIKDSSVQADVK